MQSIWPGVWFDEGSSICVLLFTDFFTPHFFLPSPRETKKRGKRCVKIWDLANCNCIGTCRAHLPPGALFQDLAMSGDGEAMVQMAISENTVLSNRANRQSSQFAIRNSPTISKTQNCLALKLTCSIVVTFHRESAR